MDSLWVFDASTADLTNALAAGLAHSTNSQHSHLVQLVEEELQERACHAELELLLQLEVTLEQSHGSNLSVECIGGGTTDAVCAKQAAASNHSSQSEQQSLLDVVQKQGMRTKCQRLGTGTRTAAVPEHALVQAQHLVSAHAAEAAGGAQHVECSGPKELDLTPHRQPEEQPEMQQSEGAVPLQQVQQQERLHASSASHDAGRTPLQSARHAFLEEQQRIRKAQMALHKPQMLRGRPALVKVPQHPSLVKAPRHAELHKPTRQQSGLHQLQQHCPVACNPQLDKWHTVAVSQPLTRCSATAAGKDSELNAAVGTCSSHTHYQAVESTPARDSADTAAALFNFPSPIHSLTMGTVESSYAAGSTGDHPAIAATVKAAAATGLPQVSSTAVASPDNCRVKLSASLAGAGTPTTTAVVAAGGVGFATVDWDAEEQLQQSEPTHTNHFNVMGRAADSSKSDQEGTAVHDETSGQQGRLQGELLPGCQAPAALLFGCITAQHAEQGVEHQHHHHHHQQQCQQQLHPYLHGMLEASAAQSTAHLYQPAMQPTPPIQQKCMHQRACQQTQQPSNREQLPPQQQHHQAAHTVVEATLHTKFPLAAANWSWPAPSFGTRRFDTDQYAAPVQHVDMLQPLYKCVTGRAGVHQPLQLDSWQNWDVMASSMDDSQDGFGAWAAPHA